MTGERAQHGASEARRSRLELVAGAPRLLAIAGGQHDLDAGRQEPGPLDRLGRPRHDLVDRGSRRLGPPLREQQQRQARLRLVAEAARIAVGPLGCRQVALEAKDLRLPVGSLAGGDLVRPQHEALPRQARLLERSSPVAAELHELGAMDEARARERHHARLLIAPPASAPRSTRSRDAARAPPGSCRSGCSRRDRRRSATARPPEPRPWPRPACRAPPARAPA